ncbi:VWA domain-containing protein [Lentisalinibacter orientalis]|uniref:VWA domain-containing protein n=1 Tax=Lentisalinibacter orientalis TaxID=2992241 RepID=UPI0038682941
MPAEFHFLRPLWLLAIPAVLALAWWLASRRLDAGSWRAVIDERMRPYVLDDRGAAARGRGPYWLVAALGVLASVALAGPAWERQKQELYRGGDSLVVALDLSRSMDAADVAPSRLARARLKLLDLLERRQEGQTALIVYSAHAFTVTPLTDDVDTIAALVGSLSTDIMPSRGSLPERALAKARELLEQAGASRGHVLLIGDGAAGEPVRAAGALRDAGYRVSVLGVGTAEGGPLPKPDGGFVTDPSGRMVLPALEESLLQEIAIAGGGIYRRLSVDDGDLEAVLAAMGPGAPGTRAGNGGNGREFFTELWHDRGPWLVLALLPLAALAFRRGWLLVLVVLAMPLPRPAEAADWQDLWLTPDQQAARALEEGRADEAAELFEDPAWQAAARYRAGDYAASAEAFAGLDSVDAAYNRGNALARQGEFEAAMEAYEQALAAEPDHEDARHNLDLLRQLQQQQQQQPGGEGESGDGQDGQQSQDGQQQSAQNQEQAGEDGESGGAQQDGEPAGEQGADGSSQAEAEGESSPSDAEEQRAIEELREEMRRAAEAAEAGDDGEQNSRRMAAASGDERSRQEQMQAMEQWLRRVPNDPGGLLRRKFRDQYQREGRDQDGNPLWTEQEEVQPW